MVEEKILAILAVGVQLYIQEMFGSLGVIFKEKGANKLTHSL